MHRLFRLIAALPLHLVHAIGAALGVLVYLASRSYRERLRDNLTQAGYGPRRLALPAARAAGRQALETAWVWMRPREQIVARCLVADPEVVEAALADPRPILFLTPHLGCFEVTVQWFAATYSARHERPITVLYRVPRKAVLRDLVVSGRSAPGITLAPADVSGVRKLMRAARNREALGILPDQVPSGGEGVWAPFFGKPAYTMTLPARLARQFDAQVIFIYAQRLAGGAGWRIHMHRFDEPFTGEPEADAAAMNRGLEALIRDKPEQYLWGYNRYKAPAHSSAPPAPTP